MTQPLPMLAKTAINTALALASWALLLALAHSGSAFVEETKQSHGANAEPPAGPRYTPEKPGEGRMQ